MNTPPVPEDPARLARSVARGGVGAGLFVLCFTVYWVAFPAPVATPLQGRFANNGILAFEFARSADDVAALIGPGPGSDEQRALRRRLDTINRADFVYLVCYGVLLAAGSVGLAHRRRMRRFQAGVVVFAVAAAADGMENVALLALTSSPADMTPHLTSLRFWTLLKWELLAAGTAALSVGLLRDLTLPRGVRALCATGLLALPLGVLTVVDPSTWSPFLTLSFVPLWLVVFFVCVRDARAPWRVSRPAPAR